MKKLKKYPYIVFLLLLPAMYYMIFVMANLPTFKGVYFRDLNNGWIVGHSELGGKAILYTKDGGHTWSEKQIATANMPTGVYFITPDKGWILDAGKILSTKDGGNTWNEKDMGKFGTFKGFCFTTPDKGWILCAPGNLLYTADGGDTWQEKSLQVINEEDSLHRKGMSLNGISFGDAKNGWIVGNFGTILYTADGGNTWHKKENITGADLCGVYFSDPVNGWIAGLNGTVLNTKNGGNTWKMQSLGALTHLRGVYFSDPGNGWLVGDFKTIVHTKDGGNTWKTEQRNNGLLIFIIAFFIFALYTVYMLRQRLRARPGSIYFVDEMTGWVAGSKGRLLKTTDGGSNWKIQEIPSKEALRGIYFVDSDNGWVVGDDGTILHTKNGGLNWNTQYSGVSKELKAVYFADVKNGWIVGDDRTILSTKDGGASWKNRQILNAENLSWPLSLKEFILNKSFNGVCFVDDKFGWVVGSGGKLLHTRDGGLTWNEQKVYTSSELYEVRFLDDSNGWIAGHNGVYHTKDGGVNWEAQKNENRVIGLHFADLKNGWICGGIGKIFHTKDGGVTWGDQKSNSIEFLEKIHFLNHEKGWVLRGDGKVLYTTNGGMTWTLSGKY